MVLNALEAEMLQRCEIEKLDTNLLARVFSTIKFGAPKLRLQIVCKTWRAAMLLAAAHPQQRIKEYYMSLRILSWLPRNVENGLNCLTELMLNSGYCRAQQIPDLLNLTSLQIMVVAPLAPLAPMRLPKMPNLIEMTFISSDDSGHDIMQNHLMDFPLLSLFIYRFEEMTYQEHKVPEICVREGCEVRAEMAHAYPSHPLVIPVATQKNLTRLVITLDSDMFPDLRECKLLKNLEFWVEENGHTRLMSGMNLLPDKVENVMIVCDDFVAVKDFQGFSQFRFLHTEYGFCTCMVSEFYPTAAALSDELYNMHLPDF